MSSLPDTHCETSPFETVVREAAAQGKWADFTKYALTLDDAGRAEEPRVVLPARLIRELLVGFHNVGPDQRPQITDFGLRIRGACVEGRIDLRGARAWNSEACPPLVLEDCELRGDLKPEEWADPRVRRRASLDALDADLVFLALLRCRLSVLDLRAARVRSDVRMVRCGPLEEGGACWVRGDGMTVGGDWRVKRSIFCVEQTVDWQPGTPSAYAFDISQSRVHGSVVLQPACVFDGGVSVGQAQIEGDVWIAGGHLMARDNHALYAQMASVGGGVGLQGADVLGGETERFRSEGTIFLYGAQIGSTLSLDGAKLTTHPRARDPKSSIYGNLTKIQGDVLMRTWTSRRPKGAVGSHKQETATPRRYPFEAQGAIYFHNVTVAGFVDLNGSAPAFYARQSCLSSFCHVMLKDGSLDLGSATIDGEIAVRGKYSRVYAASLQAGGKALFSGHFGSEMDFTSAIFAGELTLESLTKVPKIVASNAHFESHFSCSGSAGEIDFAGVQLKGRLSITGECETFRASSSKVLGDVSFRGTFTQSIDLRNASFGGSLRLAPNRYLWRHLLTEHGLKAVPKAVPERRESASDPGPEAPHPISLGPEGWFVRGLRLLILEDADWLEGWDDVRFVHRRRRQLACYPNWQLWECVAWLPRGGDLTSGPSRDDLHWPPGELGVVAFLYEPEKKWMVVLDGRSNPIHQLNSRKVLQLNTEEQATDYLRFFCSYLWGEEGAFQIIESLDQLPPTVSPRFLPADEGEAPASPDRWIRPLEELGRGPDGAYLAKGTVLYGGALFEATFRCPANGFVDMLTDEPCGWLEGGHPASYRRPARIVRRLAGGADGNWLPPPQLVGEWIDESAGLGDFNAESPPSVSLTVENARFSGDVSLDGIFQPVLARGLRVEGQLKMGGVVEGRLELEGAKIRGNLIFERQRSPVFGEIPLRLRAAKESYTRGLGEESREPERWLLNLESATVGGSFQVAGLEAVFEERAAETPQWHDGRRITLRSRALVCAPGWHLWEAHSVLEPSSSLLGLWPSGSTERPPEVGVMSFLHHAVDGRMEILDGTPKPLSALLAEGALHLEREEQIVEYLLLWFGYTHQPQKTPGAKLLLTNSDFPGLLSTAEQSATELTTSTLVSGRPSAADSHDVRIFPPCVGSPDDDGRRTVEMTLLFRWEIFRGKIEFRDDEVPPSIFELALEAVGVPPGRESFPIFAAGVRTHQLSSEPGDSVFSDLGGAIPEATFRLPSPWLAGEWVMETDDFAAARLYEELLLESGGSAAKKDLWELISGDAKEHKAGINLHRCVVGALVDDDGGAWDPRLRLKLDGFDYGWTDASQPDLAPTEEKQEGFGLDPESAATIVRNHLREQLPRWRRLVLEDWWTTADRWQGWVAQWRRPLSSGRAARRQPWERRLEWLDRQFDRQRAARVSPQPFEHLAAVLSKQGSERGARRALEHKLQLERRERPWWSGRHLWLFDMLFGHGLRPWRALATFLLFVVLGAYSFDAINHGAFRLLPVGNVGLVSKLPEPPLLVVEVTGVTEVLRAGNGATYPMPAGLAGEAACADRIEPLLYSLDVFVPLLDIGHESRCAMTTRPEAWPWRLLKGAYRVGGWIVTSLLLLTVTGLLRKHVER